METLARKIIKPNPLSFRSHKVLLRSNFKPIENDNEETPPFATGFFYKHVDDIYFITNWHVVSGKHPDTNKTISNDDFKPTKLRIIVRDKDIASKAYIVTQSNFPNKPMVSK